LDHAVTDVRAIRFLVWRRYCGVGQETADVPDAPHVIALFLGEITQRHTRLRLAVLALDPDRSVGLHTVPQPSRAGRRPLRLKASQGGGGMAVHLSGVARSR
jgi:hypothetical protein